MITLKEEFYKLKSVVENRSLLTGVRLLREDKTELKSPNHSNLISATTTSNDEQVTERSHENVQSKKKNRKKKTQGKQSTSPTGVPAKKCTKQQTSSRDEVTPIILGDSTVKDKIAGS